MSSYWQEWKYPDVITQTRIKNSTRFKVWRFTQTRIKNSTRFKVWRFKIFFIVHPIWRINSNPRCKYHLGRHDIGKDSDRKNSEQE